VGGLRGGGGGLERAPAPGGGPPCYLTTRKFLEVFKLESLADLPAPNEPPQ
jgi:chromosome segregation and condensation protein ScpB